MQAEIILLILSIVLSAFFSGVEMAFVTSNKFKVELDKGKENLTGRMLAAVTRSPSRFIGTMLIGNNICLVLYGIMAAVLMRPFLVVLYDPYMGETLMSVIIIITQTVFSAMIILVTGEFLPKAIFSINPNRTLNLLIVPTAFFYYLLSIPVSITLWISRFFLRHIFRIRISEGEVSFERTDLDYYLRQLSSQPGESAEDIENEVKILQNVLEFPSVRSRECMIPRTEIAAIEVSEPVDRLKKLFIDTGHSKILVYKDTLDDMIGFVHSFDLFKKPADIRSILIPVLLVPETMYIKDILTQFIQQRRSVAVVVDEYGGTSGIMTTEDIIEEIFGDIEDEHDKEDLVEKKLSEFEYLFSGRHQIDYLNKEYHLELPEREDYTTLAGMIIHYTQDIPDFNEVIDIEDFRVKITKVTNTRIEEVLLITRPN